MLSSSLSFTMSVAAVMRLFQVVGIDTAIIEIIPGKPRTVIISLVYKQSIKHADKITESACLKN